MCGIGDPSLCINLPPADITLLRWRLQRSCRHVEGVSFGAPSAFFRGENSSSRSTSHTAKFLSHLHKTQTNDKTGETCRDIKEGNMQTFENKEKCKWLETMMRKRAKFTENELFEVQKIEKAVAMKHN